jgi:hypothetical protein
MGQRMNQIAYQDHVASGKMGLTTTKIRKQMLESEKMIRKCLIQLLNSNNLR